MILSIGDKTTFVLKIAGDVKVTGGGRLLLRAQGDALVAAIDSLDPKADLLP